MTQLYEWIHTSAPRTLEGPGYGVVARTRDIPAALEKFLRGRSRYDFLKPDLPERGFPVYAHAVFRDGRTEWHVLSRMLPCSADYTGREVFLAHHIAISADQLTGQSVVRWLLRTDLFRDAWTAQPQILEPREVPPDVRVSLPRGEWRNVTGGTAGPECFKLFKQSRKPPLFLLSDSGENNFHLLCEALLETSPAEHNRISFISATLSAQQDVQYDWIGLVRGTTFCDEQLRTAPQRVLDLLDNRRLQELQKPPQPAAPSTPIPASRPPGGLANSEIPWREDQWKPRSTTLPGPASMPTPLPPVPAAAAEPQTARGRTSLILLTLILLIAVLGGAIESLRLRKEVQALQNTLLAANEDVARLKQKEQEQGAEFQKIAGSSTASLRESQEKIAKLTQDQKTSADLQKQHQETLAKLQAQHDQQKAAAEAAQQQLRDTQAARTALQAELQANAEIQQAKPGLTEFRIIGIPQDLAQLQTPGTHLLAQLPEDFPTGPKLALELIGSQHTGLETKIPADGSGNGVEIVLKTTAAKPGVLLTVAGAELKLTLPDSATDSSRIVLDRLRCCCLSIRAGERRLLLTLNQECSADAVHGTGSKARGEREELSTALQELEQALRALPADQNHAWKLEWRMGTVAGDQLLPDLKSHSGILWLSWQQQQRPPLEYPLTFWKQ